MLSASRIMTRAEGDCNVTQSKHGSIEADFEAWKTKFLTRLQGLCKGEKKPCSGKCKKGKCKSSGKHSKESSDHEHGTSEHENTEVQQILEALFYLDCLTSPLPPADRRAAVGACYLFWSRGRRELRSHGNNKLNEPSKRRTKELVMDPGSKAFV